MRRATAPGLSPPAARVGRVVGVGPRAALHRPDVVVRDLTEVRVKAVGASGSVELYVG